MPLIEAVHTLLPHYRTVKMERTFTWLHLSDFHLRAGNQYDQNVVIASLLADINNQREQRNVTADAIFLTGDIAFSGKAEEYQVARDFIEELGKVSGVELSNVFCVPGNHDVDRSRITASVRGESRAFTSREQVSRIIGTAQLSLFTDRYAPYSEFIRTTFPWASHWSDYSLSFTQNLAIRGINVSLLGLNSAWVSGDDDDKGNLLIGERQIREALDKAKQPEILIALFHHPLSYLADFDSSDAQALLDTRCDFVLHGHLHETHAARLVSPDSEVFYLAAGATYQDQLEVLAYNRVTLHLDEGQAEDLLKVATSLNGILERETSSHISLASFVDHYVRLLDFPTDVLTALGDGEINLFEAAQLTRITAERLGTNSSQAKRTRAVLLSTHLQTKESGPRLRERVNELLRASSNEAGAAERFDSRQDLEDFDPYDPTHLFWDQIKQLGFALRDIRREDVIEEEIDELLKASEPVLTIIARIQRRKERGAIKKILI